MKGIMDLPTIIVLLRLALTLLTGAQNGTPEQKIQASLFAGQAITLATKALSQTSVANTGGSSVEVPSLVIPIPPPVVANTNNPVLNPPSCELNMWAEIQYSDSYHYSPILHYSWRLVGAIDPYTIGKLISLSPWFGNGFAQYMDVEMKPANNPAFTVDRLPLNGGTFEANFKGVKCSTNLPQLYPWTYGSSTAVYSTP